MLILMGGLTLLPTTLLAQSLPQGLFQVQQAPGPSSLFPAFALGSEATGELWLLEANPRGRV